MLSHPAERYCPIQIASAPGLPRRAATDRQSLRPCWLSTDQQPAAAATVRRNGVMDSRKLQFWILLLECGFSEIEVAFLPPHKLISTHPRILIDTVAHPEDVTIQVLTQARDPLICAP